MKVKDVLTSKNLTRAGALRIVESLLEGETQVDVNTGDILYCYGSEPQSYATAESVCGIETVSELVEDFNNGYGIVNEQPYENLKLLANILGISLEV